MTEPTSSLTPNEQTKSKPSRRYRLLGGLFFLIAATLTAGGVCWFLHNGIGTKAQLPTGATVIYEKMICSGKEANKKCTVKIFRKVNDKTPEKLATLTDVKKERYSSKYVLSPDKKTLVIGQADKVLALDLASKKLTTLLVAKKEFQAIIYSPKGDLLFLWDQNWNYQKDLEDYYVHIFNLRNMKDKIIDQGQSSEMFFSKGVWRKDNKVLLAQPETHFYKAYYFDLNKNKLFPLLNDSEEEEELEEEEIVDYGDIVSTDGRTAVYFGVPSDVNELCEGPIGYHYSTHVVYESISLKKIGEFGDENRVTFVERFSPDNSQILYFTADKPQTEEECDENKNATYFLFNLKEKASTPVADLKFLLQQWDGPSYMSDRNDIEIIARYMQR